MAFDRESLRASYDLLAREYAERYLDELDHKPFDREVLDRFADAVRDQGIVYDLGCGPGQIARYLRGRGVDVVALDLSRAMIEIGRRLVPEVPFVQGDLTALPAAHGSLAGAASFYSLIHLSRDEIVPGLREVKRALRPGGSLLLAVHLGEKDLHLEELWGHAVRIDAALFQRGEMERYLVQAGLEIEQVLEREPYPEVEYQSRRVYLFARAPFRSARILAS